MATITNTVALNARYNRYNSHNLTTRQDGASRERTAVCDVTFAATGEYATGGVVIDFSGIRGFTKIITCEIIHNPLGAIATYVPGAGDSAALGKLKLFGTDPAATGGAIAVLPELPATDTALQDAIFRVRITGI